MTFPIINENFLSEDELNLLLNYAQNSQELS
jgi:hypothetical protein